MLKISNSTRRIVDLPLEILESILRYLSVSDQISFGATCRYFYEVTCGIHFCGREKVILCKDKMDGDRPLIQVLRNSTKKFHHYYFEQVEFGDKLEDFWQTFGPDIYSLYIARCDMHEKALGEALSECSHLEELHIISCHDILMSGRLLESKEERAILKKTLNQLKFLDLSSNRYLSDALFTRFAHLTNKMHTLFLNGCNISFHKGLYKKFYPSQNFDSPSESVLTFKFILEFLRDQASTIKSLDFSSTLIDGSALSSLAQIQGLELSCLKLQQCDQLTNSGILELCNRQQCLVELDCSFCSRMTDQSLIAISNGLINLQKLYIRRCRALTDVGISELDKLVNLKVLDISECSTFITSKGIEEAICSKYNERMNELILGGLEITENVVLLITDNLPNLRVLDLGGCGNAVTNLCVQNICSKLQWLRELNLDHCYRVTDTGLTGVLCTTVDDEMLNFYRMTHAAKTQENMMINLKINEGYNHFNDENLMNGDNGIAKLRGLMVLKLQGCRLTDLSLKALRFLELKKLSLSHCLEFTLAGFENMVQYCPALEILNLEASKVVTDEIVLCIVKNLPRLKVLVLDKCTQITNSSLDSILCYGKYIRYVSFNGCEQLNDFRKLSDLNSKVPHCIVEHNVLSSDAYVNWKSTEYSSSNWKTTEYSTYDPQF